MSSDEKRGAKLKRKAKEGTEYLALNPNATDSNAKEWMEATAAVSKLEASKTANYFYTKQARAKKKEKQAAAKGVAKGLLDLPFLIFPIYELMSEKSMRHLQGLFQSNIKVKVQKLEVLGVKRYWFCSVVHLAAASLTAKRRIKNKEEEQLLAVHHAINAATADFVKYVQLSYPRHIHVRQSLLISEPRAPSQDRLHYDMHLGDPGYGPFTCIIAIGSPFNLRWQRPNDAMDVAVSSGWCVKFDSSVYHDGAANDQDTMQYRIQLKFATTAEQFLDESILTVL